jgi:hypothetical protein
VPRDLEAICLKCLEYRPERRYATAAGLADDLRRYLAGEPTIARAASPAKRLLKWTRRRPALAGLLTVSLAASLAIIGLTAVYIARLQSANETAEALRAESPASAAESKTQAKVANELLYASRMKHAFEWLEHGEVEQVADILAPYESGGPLAHLRGFEWYHLKRRLHGERLTLTGHRGEVYAVAFAPDGRLLASGAEDGLIKFWAAGSN